MHKLSKLPMNLQLFAETTEPPATQNQDPPATQQNTGGQQTTPPAVDYQKIQQMLEGTLAAKEETALKSYFKQQGLSQQEAEQAMATFRQQKAEQQPDVNAIQQQLAQAQATAQQAEIEKQATIEALGIGIDIKTVPYMLKMADLSKAVGQDGKIDTEAMKTALNKVLEDVPALKPTQEQVTGFQIGASGNGEQAQSVTDDELDKIFGIKKK